MATASALEGLGPMQRRDSKVGLMIKMFKSPDTHASFLTSSRFAHDLISVGPYEYIRSVGRVCPLHCSPLFQCRSFFLELAWLTDCDTHAALPWLAVTVHDANVATTDCSKNPNPNPINQCMGLFIGVSIHSFFFFYDTRARFQGNELRINNEM